MRLIWGKHLLKLQYKQYVFAEGVCSVCGDGQHVLMLDFDGYNLSKVESCCRMIQERYTVGTFYVFKTDEDAYHAYCLDKFPMHDCLCVMDWIGLERNYVALCYRRGYFTLRISGKGSRPKPVHVLTLHAPTKRHQSSAHAKWLSLLLGKDIKGTDGLSYLKIDRYATFPFHKRN